MARLERRAISESVPTGLVYRFGSFELDTNRGVLTKNGADVPLRPKSFEVLHYLLVHRGILVTRDQLFDAVWPGVVVTPDSINQCIIEIRKALEDCDRSIVRTMPRRGFIFDIPVVTISATGEVTAASEPLSESARSWPRRWFRSGVVVVLTVLIIATAYLFVDVFERSTKDGGDRNEAHELSTRSIVVLPFTDLSPHQDQDYLADGLAEELTTHLARIDGLRVISRTSAFAFKGKPVGTSEIAERLGVGYILEGSVRTDGGQLRVTAQLIDAHDDKHLWAEEYERPFEAIFQVQDEIIALIIRDLGINVGEELPQIRRTDPAAYALYLQAKGPRVTEDAVKASVEKLKEALEIDPSFSTAWAALGQRYFWLATNFFETYGEETFELARSSANRALRWDAYCAPAHSLLGQIAVFENRLKEAAGHFERALQLEPNNPAIAENSAMLLQSLGRFDEALQVYEFALDRDPLSYLAHANYALTALMDRQMELAEEHWRKAFELNSEGPSFVPLFIGLTLGFSGDNRGALEFLEDVDQWYKPLGLAWIYQKMGRTEDFKRELAKTRELEGGQPREVFARVYALLGDADATFERLDLIEDYSHWNRERYFPFYWPIEHDPRWEEFLERAGVSDSQLSEVEFNFKRATPR